MEDKKKLEKRDINKPSATGDGTGKKPVKTRPEGSLLDKLEETVIDLDYSNLLVSAMGHWLPVEALSIIENIFEDGIIGPSKISDDVVDALDFIFEASKYPKKEYEISQQKEEKVERDILPLVEDLRNKGCRFFENLIFSIFETPIELTAIEVARRLSDKKEVKTVDVVTCDGYSHSVFNVEDLESIDKYGLSKTEKEFLEDRVLSELKGEEIVLEDKKYEREPIFSQFNRSMGDYLDSGGVLFLRRPQGGVEELRTRDQIWEKEPDLINRIKKEFLGLPDYVNLVKKID